MSERGKDLLWAAAAAGAAFAVYVRTLAPGLVAVLDTPMFQFIGRVLGVAHNPGYPLYVLLTYPVAHAPFGSLAYRINLFSAVCGGLTVGFVFLVGRELGCRRVVAASAALGLALGHVFWSQAVIAEVYTLDTAIIAAMLFAMLVWGRTRRAGWFYAAVGLLAAGLGNHTTIIGFAPGMAVYAWLTDRSFALRVRTMVTTAIILAAGLAQYGFILWRSQHPGAYVESPARTVGELLGVMRGQQFGDRLFAFGWRDVVFERLPWLIRDIVTPELTLAGVALSAAGAGWLLWRRPAEWWLLMGGCLATAFFTLNYSVIDLPVFMIPATAILWVAAGVGGEQAVRAVRHRPVARMGALAMFALPAWLLVSNFAVTDRSHDRGAADTFDRLFEVLPDRSRLVREDFLVDRMVMFKLLGDRAAEGREIEPAGRDPDALLGSREEGWQVYGFGRSVRRLRYEGLDFNFAPLPLLGDRLSSHLANLPAGSVVALAVPAAYAEALAASEGAGLASIGVDAGQATGRKAALVLVGVSRTRTGAAIGQDPFESRLGFAEGSPIGDTSQVAPAAFSVRAGLADASVEQGGRDVVSTREGAVMAVWRPDGVVAGMFILEALDDFRVPVQPGALSVYPLRGALRRLAIGGSWTPLGPVLSTGVTMLRIEPGTPVVVYLSAVHPLAPRVVDQSSPAVVVDIATADDKERAVLEDAGEPSRGGHVYRIDVRTDGPDAASVLLALGGVPEGAAARVVSSTDGASAAAFEVNTQGLLRARDRASEVLLMARDEQAYLTGAGWSAVDWDEVSPFRWLLGEQAQLLLPAGRGDLSALRMQAFSRGQEAGVPGMLRVALNGVDLGGQTTGAGWQSYEWEVPAGIGREGTNHLELRLDTVAGSAGDETPRLAVAEITLRFGGS